MIIFLLLVTQFNLYYQHNFGNASYIWTYYDINGDGHKDAVVSYPDSVVIFTLIDNQMRAAYLPSPYQYVNFISSFGNNDAIIFRYSYDGSSGTYTGKIYYYTSYSVLSWESSEITSYYYTYPVTQILDVDGDGYSDIVMSYRGADSTLNLVIYKGSVQKIEENLHSTDRNVKATFSNITFNLSQSGRCKIVVYDNSGRSVGKYFYEGKKGRNVFIPPFLPRGAAFYRIFQNEKLVEKGVMVR